MDAPIADGPGQPLLTWLAQTAQRLGADRVLWMPVRRNGRQPAATGWPRYGPREIDWPRVERVDPGSLTSSLNWTSTSPRSARSAYRWLWIGAPRTPDGSARGRLGLGILRTRGPQEVESWPADALLALAEAAGAAQSDQRPRAETTTVAAPGTGSTEGVLHDLRNQLTLTGLLFARAREGAGAGWDEVEEQLSEARSLCVNGLQGGLEPSVRVALRPLLLREVRAASQSARRQLEPPARLQLRCSEDCEWGTRPGLLARVVRNLVLNALEASFPGGLVRVWASTSEACAQVVVEDEGRGMGPQSLRRLFEAGLSDSGGTGFGTASLRACVTELEAELEVHSSPGSGTRVRVRLPNLAGAVQPVLVLDPDPARRHRRCADLQAQGLPTLDTAQPQRALELLRRRQPSRVLIARGCPPGRAGGAARRSTKAGAPSQLAELRRRAFEQSIPVRVLPAGSTD